MQPALLYVQKGGSVNEPFTNDDDFTGDIESSFSLDYIELPVFVKYSVTGSAFAPSFYVGSYATYNVRRGIGADTEGNDGSSDLGPRGETEGATSTCKALGRVGARPHELSIVLGMAC